MNMEAHVAGMELNARIRMGGGVVEKVNGCFGGCLGALSLCGGKRP